MVQMLYNALETNPQGSIHHRPLQSCRECKRLLKPSKSNPLNRKLTPTSSPITESMPAGPIVRIRKPRANVTRPLASPQPQPRLVRLLSETKAVTAPSARNTRPIAEARALICIAAGTAPDLN